MRNSLLLGWYKRFPPRIPGHYAGILSQYSHYYHQLDIHQRERFLRRLSILIRHTRFVPQDIPRITEEMKVLVGSAIIQITFGLKTFTLRKFRKIIIVPRVYTYKGMEHLQFIGDTNAHNHTVSLSWPHVKLGFEIKNDAQNLALHEIAHCLRLEDQFLGYSERLFNEKDLAHWEQIGKQRMVGIRKRELTFMKTYAGRDMMEMFAVSVEYFFEKPVAFREQLPELYEAMVMLLNQDPTRAHNPVLG